MSKFQIQNRHLCDVLFRVDNSNRTVEYLVKYLRKNYSFLSTEQLNVIELQLNRWLPFFRKKYRRDGCNIQNQFYNKCASWLSSSFEVQFEETPKYGRKRKQNDDSCCKSTMYRRVNHMVDTNSSEYIKIAFFKSLRETGKGDLVKIIKRILQDSPESDDNNCIPLSANEI